jgi:hypothetical protein
MNSKSIIITVVVALVVAVAAFFGGRAMGVQAGMQQAQDIRAAFAASRGGGNGQGGVGGGGGQNGSGQFNPNNFAAGQVKSIDGNTVQLSTAQSVVTVQLTNQTQIQKMGAGTVSDIQAGQRITVQGTRAADGTMTAQSIQIGGNRPFGGGGGQGGDRQAQGTPQARTN